MGLFDRFKRKDPAELEAFLSRVVHHNDHFNALSAGSQAILLVHPFWSRSDIESGLAVRAEWKVPAHLVPFYGDWHDLLCLNPRNGSVLMLNDQRQVIGRWASIEAFEGALTSLPEERLVSSGLIEEESWLAL